jgi:hypothetical protein
MGRKFTSGNKFIVEAGAAGSSGIDCIGIGGAKSLNKYNKMK